MPRYFEGSLKGAWRVRAQGSIAAGAFLIQCWQDICNYTLTSPEYICSMCAFMCIAVLEQNMRKVRAIAFLCGHTFKQQYLRNIGTEAALMLET